MQLFKTPCLDMLWRPLVFSMLLYLAGGVLAPASFATSGIWLELANRQNCEVWYAAAQKPRTAVWTGSCLDGKAQGEGQLILRFFEGNLWKVARFEGHLRAGRAEEEGFMIRKDGAQYEGAFENGLFHGTGVMHFPNGDFYRGEWKEGLFNGAGVYYFAPEDWREAEFPDKGPFPDSYLHRLESSRYEGEFRQGLPTGEGGFLSLNGRFEGAWQPGCFQRDANLAGVIAIDESCRR